MSDAPRLAGQSVRDLMWAFEQLLGQERASRALAAVPEPHRSAYVGADPHGWVAYDTVVAAHERMAAEAGTTMEELLERAVPLAVEHAFSTVWRVLLRFTTDEVLIARTPLLYSRTRSKGRMTASRTAPGRAVCEVSGWPDMPPRDVRSIAISIETVLRLAGRKEVATVTETGPSGPRFHLTWK
jgi:hypothetical protein